MKMIFLSCGLIVTGLVGNGVPALSQVVIPSVPDNLESQYLEQWNRRHAERREWTPSPRDFSPDDAIRLLQRRGYRVFGVNDVGLRYLVRAWRDGDHLLVSLSREGEIMGVVHDRTHD
ncbi:hypothetical protein MSC49_32350 [Methylosinus sp. C49]|uniref:hypothetical protein n=1 Tax=Methylosinus sp. C49 TaxID=2699395 RepID=UPI0013672C07|nr:hypothetical protein [Methylosinus sp. C49]BBU63300.1 hypothetical protein MSC49_32350 [Methylosinus sp. C49]